MTSTRTILLLLILCNIIAVVTSDAYFDEDLEDEGSLKNLNILEDMSTVFNDKEKKRTCVDKKGAKWCKMRYMFFRPCNHKSMIRNCRETCRHCRG